MLQDRHFSPSMLANFSTDIGEGVDILGLLENALSYRRNGDGWKVSCQTTLSEVLPVG